MAFYLSPLVDVREIDLTTTIPAVATNIAVAILRSAYKGPELKRTLVTTRDELTDMFGDPVGSPAECYEDMLSAMGYLKYGNMLYCTRAMPANATFAGTKPVSGAQSTFTQFNTSNAYKMSDFDSDDPDSFATEASFGTEEMQVIANSRGVWGNNIRIAMVDYSTYNAMVSAGTYSTWDTYDSIVAVDSPMVDAKDFLIIVQVLDQGETSYATKEVWNVSTSTTRRDDQGQIIFCENVINEQSNYIRIALKTANEDDDIVISTSEWQQFSGGQDSDDDYVADLVTDAIVIEALDYYENSEEVDVNIFIDSDKGMAAKRHMISICESRKDCIALLDCERADVVNNRGNETTDLREWRRRTLNENTSYAALYGNWLEIYDRWAGQYRWIPASGNVAGILANTDDVADPWWAPAGLNRAILTNVRKLAWNPSLGNRNILYQNGINPLVSFAGQGKVIWGQKTLLDKNSAFNRINVRRLFITLEKAVSTAVKYFLFEPNDEFTRLSLINMIEPFLRDVKSRRGIYEFSVVCDSRNNTAERIDRNELWADIYIQPVRAAEFIVLNFIATKTGASFEEIISGSA
uniref:Putative tail sheath protein n=1 Tax=viral metagenome TaxID=1070528 RepID=A0A6M3IPJ8_9ZZZZ